LRIIPIGIKKMKKSPFIFGNTVSVKAFTNRKKDKKKLYDNLIHGINSIIVSPRRWGKSSLVEKVFLDISKKEKRIRLVNIDLFSVSDENEFLEKFAQEVIKASASRLEDWLKNIKTFFKALVPEIILGSDPLNDFSIRFSVGEIKKHKDEILNLPEQIAQNKNIKFIIGLDEFQHIANYADFENLEKKLRAVWQRQKNVTYCLYGSKRHMMMNIFNNSSKPFYRFGDIMMLQKIDRKDWVAFITKSFDETDKKISNKHAGSIADLMQNHSWYVQQLAHYVWVQTAKQTDEDVIQSALNEIVAANKPLYQREIEIMSGTQLNLLKAVAAGEKHLTAAAVMQQYKLGTPRNVSKNKAMLIRNDVIDTDIDKNYYFLDPVFELWFRQEFMQ